MNINLLLLALIIIQFANAQSKDTTLTGTPPADSSANLTTFHSVDKITLNLGVGVETSGFGLNTTWYILKPLGVFGGVGYIPPYVGFASGIKLRYIKGETLSKVNPFLVGVYGSHLSISVENADYYNRLFNGFSAGVGFDTKSMNDFYWSFSIYKPFRSQEALDYIKELKNNPALRMKRGIMPIGLSINLRTIIK